MELHPTDVGYETMVFQLTSPTLNTTLKICVGRPFDENGMNRYNVYELNKKGDQVERLRGYYLLEKDVDPLDTDKDFNIKEVGEPTWITPEGVVKEVKEKAPPKPLQVSKSEFIVMEDTDSKGDCFYDALLRAKSGNPTVKSTDAAVQAERRRIGEMFLRAGPAQSHVVEMYKMYKENPDLKKDLLRYGKQMQEIPEFAPFYSKLESVPEDQVSDAKNKIMEEEEKSLPTSDWDLFDELNGTDMYPVKEEDKMALETMSEYFDRNTELSDQDAVSTFVKNVNTMQKWVVEDIVVAVQENDNVQVLPMVKEGEDVSSYSFTNTILVKPKIDDRTKYLMVEYTPLVHFKLISFRDKDLMKSLVLYDELPEVIQTKLNDNAAYRKALEKMPEPELPEPSELPESKPVKVEDVPPVEGPAPPANVVPITESVEEVPGPKQTKRKSPDKPGTRKASEDAKQLKKDKDNIPPFSAKEREEINRVEFKNVKEKIQFMIDNSEWGKYCQEKFRRAPLTNPPTKDRVNKILNSDNTDDYQTISGIFVLARP
jgi:hypothetical protein